MVGVVLLDDGKLLNNELKNRILRFEDMNLDINKLLEVDIDIENDEYLEETHNI